MLIFANPYPKIHDEERLTKSKAQKLMRKKAQWKSKAQRPAKKIEEQERPKENRKEIKA